MSYFSVKVRGLPGGSISPRRRFLAWPFHLADPTWCRETKTSDRATSKLDTSTSQANHMTEDLCSGHPKVLLLKGH